LVLSCDPSVGTLPSAMTNWTGCGRNAKQVIFKPCTTGDCCVAKVRCSIGFISAKAKAALHATKALGGRGSIAPTHSRWEWLVSVTPGERTPGTHCTGDWVGLRAGLDTEARGKILSTLSGIEPRSPGRPARSQTLYWLSYHLFLHSTELGRLYAYGRRQSLLALLRFVLRNFGGANCYSEARAFPLAHHANADSLIRNVSKEKEYVVIKTQRMQRHPVSETRESYIYICSLLNDAVSVTKTIKVKQSRYTPWRRLGGRGGIAPTHSRPRH
jgi:hypothetical protein